MLGGTETLPLRGPVATTLVTPWAVAALANL